MHNKTRIRVGDTMNAQLRSVNTHRPIVLKGEWRAECYAPMDVADPGELNSLLGAAKDPAHQSRRESGLMYMKDLRRVMSALTTGAIRDAQYVLQRLESILSGGGLKWVATIDNRIVNVGLDHLLDVALSNGSQTATWYVGLTDGTPTTAASDTMASHVGWVEVHTQYSETVRQTFVDGGVSAQSLSNSASKASFSFTASTTVGGAFLSSVATKNTTTGTLFSVEAFTEGDKAPGNGDTLDVQATFSAADA